MKKLRSLSVIVVGQTAFFALTVLMAVLVGTGAAEPWIVCLAGGALLALASAGTIVASRRLDAEFDRMIAAVEDVATTAAAQAVPDSRDGETSRLHNALKKGLRRIAQGKVSHRIAGSFAADHEDLVSGFNAMAAELNSVVFRVGTGTSGVEAGIAEIEAEIVEWIAALERGSAVRSMMEQTLERALETCDAASSERGRDPEDPLRTDLDRVAEGMRLAIGQAGELAALSRDGLMSAGRASVAVGYLTTDNQGVRWVLARFSPESLVGAPADADRVTPRLRIV
ncbi:hypothetical protein [uncultured Algimonas sp.]|uniref:hypothetical protein n=1 Tax=uncultured Algimonas sp. TaxID=1547920 RepID=UPI002637DD1C|nr:hypothetical protein [uncultured Algimonas sp.]